MARTCCLLAIFVVEWGRQIRLTDHTISFSALLLNRSLTSSKLQQWKDALAGIIGALGVESAADLMLCSLPALPHPALTIRVDGPDANECLNLRPSWSRSYECLAACLEGLGREEEGHLSKRLAAGQLRYVLCFLASFALRFQHRYR